MGNKRTCGLTVPASCVPWVGRKPLLSVDTTALCDPTTEEIIEKLDEVVASIKETLNVANISEPTCYLLPTSGKWYDIINDIWFTLCQLKAAIPSAQPINIGAIKLPVNLGCMQGSCNTSEPTILQLFELILQKLCTIEGRLSQIDPSNSSSGNLLYQPMS